METTVEKINDKLVVKLPQNLVKHFKLKEGTKVEIRIENGKIVLMPKQSLKDLIEKITPENLHSEVDWGEKKGNEVW